MHVRERSPFFAILLPGRRAHRRACTEHLRQVSRTAREAAAWQRHADWFTPSGRPAGTERRGGALIRSRAGAGHHLGAAVRRMSYMSMLLLGLPGMLEAFFSRACRSCTRRQPLMSRHV
jgi:hypothetical protein